MRAARPTRRRFIINALTGGTALGVASCGVRRGALNAEWLTPTAPPPSPSPPQGFDLISTSGSHREIGRALGAACRETLELVWRSDATFATIRAAAHGEHRSRVEAMMAAARERFPRVIEELEGMALGAGVDAFDLFAWNCRAEINSTIEPCPPGCSTVGLVADGAMILAHNEDGGADYEGRMVLLFATPPSGVSFLSLVYPGTLAGNGPGLNDHGVAQTTNYISCCAPAEGVPKYVIGRAVLEATDLEQAVAIATVEGRAFPWHHNLASTRDARLVSLETWPGRHQRRDVEGVLLHTNHLIDPEMAGLPERRDYIARSSAPRLEALQRFVETHPLERREDLLAALSDRSGEPCHVCREPGDEVPGVTLATAVYESPEVSVALSEGPPCRGLPAVTYAP